MTNGSVELPPDLVSEVEELVRSGFYSTFEGAVTNLVRLGIASLRSSSARKIPPGSVPMPERPNVPDPARDILRME